MKNKIKFYWEFYIEPTIINLIIINFSMIMTEDTKNSINSILNNVFTYL